MIMAQAIGLIRMISEVGETLLVAVQFIKAPAIGADPEITVPGLVKGGNRVVA
jgi:hypothetical protein